MEQSIISKKDAAVVFEVMDALDCGFLKFGGIGLERLTGRSNIKFFSLIPRMVNILSEYSCKSGDVNLIEDVSDFIKSLGEICEKEAIIMECCPILEDVEDFLEEVFRANQDEESLKDLRG